MKILTAKQMARWDRLTIQKHGIPARRLMGNAARACVEVLLEKSSEKPRTVVILCGPGNNGGDGFAMTHLLRKKTVRTECFFLGKVEKLSREARYFYNLVKPKPTLIQKTSHLAVLRRSLEGCDWVVDGIFGTGLNRGLTGLFAQTLKILNKSKGQKLAIDIPSGIHGDTGEVLGTAFRADITVTFEVPKWGQVQEPAWNYVGELIVRPIRLNQGELKKMKAKAQWIHQKEITRFFTPRVKDMNKGRAGRVLVVAGSATMPGAGYLSALGALRSGAGIVTWALPEAIAKKMKMGHPEILYRFLPSAQGGFSVDGVPELKKLSAGFHSLAVGPGLGISAPLVLFLESILKGIHRPMVLDADALNLISAHPRLIKYLHGKILTPHPKEMARLVHRPLKEILAKRLEITRRFAKRHKAYVVLKSYRSVVANPKGEAWINSTGGPNLAVAGSGDVLTGIIAGLLAQGLSPQYALMAGTYLHGRAGDEIAKRLGDRGTLASEIAAEVPKVIKELIDGFPTNY
jgi:ADP-dependent NAD(P)H-hydrate dehydratase / NAD(P)H-hydrate epimerase